MPAAKKPKALIDAEKKISELEAQLAQEKASKDMWYKSYIESNAIVEGIHDVLDDLGIRGYKDEGKYTRVPLSVRLFAWAMKLSTTSKQV